MLRNSSIRSLISLFLLVLSTSAFSYVVSAADILSPEQYSDMPSGWSREAVESAINNGFLYGSGGKIYPKNYLTRAQLAAVTNRVFGIDGFADLSDYYDVPQSAWFYNEFSATVYKRTMIGANGALFPDRDASREEVFVVLSRALNFPPSTDMSVLEEFSDYDQISHWAYAGLATMVENGYMYGANGKLQPKAKITREEFAYVLYQLPSELTLSGKPVTSSIETETIPSEVDNSDHSYGANNYVNLMDSQTYDNDVYISKEIAGNDLTISGTHINGRLIIDAVDFNSLTINSNTFINEILISEPTESLIINNEGGTVKSVIIDCSGEISFKGDYDTIALSAAGASAVLTEHSTSREFTVQPEAVYSQVSLASASSTDELYVDAFGSSVIADSSLIKSLNISESAAGAQIILQNSANADELFVSAIDVNLIARTNSKILNLVINSSAINVLVDTDLYSEIQYISDNGIGTQYVD